MVALKVSLPGMVAMHLCLHAFHKLTFIYALQSATQKTTATWDSLFVMLLLDAASLHSKLSFARQPGLRAALIAAMSGKGSLLLLSFLVFFYNMHVLGHNLGYMSLECGNWP